MQTAPNPTPIPSPPTTTAPADGSLFSSRAQIGLFAILSAVLGLIAWNSYRGQSPAEKPAIAVVVKVDLNRAGRAELLLLPGVGPELANRILDHRERQGPFDGIGDLRKISGIGPTILEKLRPHVSISWPENVEAKKAIGEPILRVQQAAMKTAKAPSEPLDINSASLAELQKLPGIGPKLAQRIVDARTDRPFAALADVRRVPGIGPKTLDKIKPHITLGQSTAQALN